MSLVHVPELSRMPKIPIVLLVVVSLVCTQVPLFNYLGFEFSAVIAIVAGFLAGVTTLSRWKREETSLHHREESETRPGPDEQLWKFLKRLTPSLALLCVVPALLLSLNALIVKNCSFLHGAMIYALLVIPSVVFAGTLALVIAVSGSRWKRSWFVLLYLVLLVDVATTTITRPQIFAFNPILGFFPGITFDETLNIEGRLLMYRWATLAASLSLLVVAVAIHRRRSNRMQLAAGRIVAPQPILHTGEWIAGILTTGIVIGAFIFSNELGLSSSIASIEAELGGRMETQHFIVVYPAQTVSESDARQLALLHEFYYARVAQELRVVSARKIRSFLYATPEQKGRLIGSARTNIAKPWLWQVHLNAGDVETSLRHELVHVLAADFGFPIFRVGLNPGLIEGLAMAVERVQFDETIHRVAAQIVSLDLPVNVKSLFSLTGFARVHPGISYSLAGSFCRFLIDQYGMRRFKRLYRSGDFRAVYNRDIDILVAEWKRHLARYTVDDDERSKAAYRFKRPSIFGKECARVIANLNAETQKWYEQGEFRNALASANRSLQLSTSAEAMLQKMISLLRIGQYREALTFAEESLRDTLLAHALLPLRMQLGDAQWALGETQQAASTYANLLRKKMSLSMDEALVLRLEALKTPSLAAELLPYFVSPLSDSLKVSHLRSALNRHPHNELVVYLLAREYAGQRQERQAIELFRRIERMSSELLELQRQLRISRLEYGLGQFQRAKIHFWQAMNYTTSEALQLRIREWLDRCEWMTNPPRELFEQKNGEVLSLLRNENSREYQPKRTHLLPWTSN